MISQIDQEILDNVAVAMLNSDLDTAYLLFASVCLGKVENIKYLHGLPGIVPKLLEIFAYLDDCRAKQYQPLRPLTNSLNNF